MLHKLANLMWFIADHKIKETLATIMALCTVGWSTTLFMVDPLDPGSYSVAFSWAIPQLWAINCIVLALVLLLAIRFDSKQAMWPALMLMLTFALFTVSILLSVPHGGLPTDIWVFLAFTLVYALITASCAFSDLQFKAAISALNENKLYVE